jgi:hypothetical protein
MPTHRARSAVADKAEDWREDVWWNRREVEMGCCRRIGGVGVGGRRDAHGICFDLDG